MFQGPPTGTLFLHSVYPLSIVDSGLLSKFGRRGWHIASLNVKMIASVV
jgi:hypothetical protein